MSRRKITRKKKTAAGNRFQPFFVGPRPGSEAAETFGRWVASVEDESELEMDVPETGPGEYQWTVMGPHTGARVLDVISTPAQDESLRLYMKAHRLMPPNYLYDSASCARLVSEAIRSLWEDQRGAESLLRAIAILGHSPCPEAIEALTAFGDRDHPLAGVAAHAITECSAMIEYCSKRGIAV
ncbi:MAG: hypothetical protein R6V85_09145 [Polyangia bacterium]